MCIRDRAIILYGDLDISVIDELPAGRQTIKNCVVDPGYRPKAYAFIERQVAEGHQAYVICPRVEESEMIEAENCLLYTSYLSCAAKHLRNVWNGQWMLRQETVTPHLYFQKMWSI